MTAGVTPGNDQPTPAEAAAEAITAPVEEVAGRFTEAWRLLRSAARGWQRDNATRLSAAVAMYSILSLAPLLVISIKVVSVVLEEQAATRQVERQVRGFLGPRGAAAVNEMVEAAAKPDAGIVATLVSAGVLLFTASGVFVELRDSLNAIFGVDPKVSTGILGAIRDRLLSVGMVFAVGFLLLVSQVITTALTSLSERFGGEEHWASVLVDLVTSTVVITLLFALMFRFLPDARVEWRAVLAGSVVTAALFKVGQYLQALYFTHLSTASAYGAAGSFVVILLWVYYSCWILFFGAELIRAYVRRQGERIQPTADARRVPAKEMKEPAADRVREMT
jgi:membrane protein